MKRSVWQNKSNDQLCVTIPKDSGIKDGDVVDVKKGVIDKIAYLGVVGDLFHYGHLRSITFAKSISDYLICGVFTDELVESYRAKPVANLSERKSVISALKYVDKVMVQQARDPTENLTKIHEEFPEAEIILVHGDDLKYVHGSEYIRSIGGKIVQHPYYDRLSNFKIIQHLIENKDSFRDIKGFTSYIGNKTVDLEDLRGNKFVISTKADTLRALKPLLKKSRIEEMFSFSLSDWRINKDEIVRGVVAKFSPNTIAIRSSAINEDSLDKSMAGYFESILDVDSRSKEEIEKAISKVVKCYKDKKCESSFNQVLVQMQTKDIVMSGVVFTRTIEKNSPYYVINYDDSSGRSDTITKGDDGKLLVISRFRENISVSEMYRLIDSVKEIEALIPHLPLDIEFAQTKSGEIVIFQVRPLSINVNKKVIESEVASKIRSMKEKFKELSKKKSHLAGEFTYFADMPDWNPAEIIGSSPNVLDCSLYDYLITNSAWHEARATQGYYNVRPAKLVEVFGNKPYVNVRCTFNSFIPASISNDLREKLVEFYMDKLQKNPQLQDKVEFEVLHTCYDLNFDERSKELIWHGLSFGEIHDLKSSLIKLTNDLVLNFRNNVDADMRDVFSLEVKRDLIKTNLNSGSPIDLINKAKFLLEDCRANGTVQFSRIARLAFIAKALLKSMVSNRIISQDSYDQLLRSISTVATKISTDFGRLNRGEISKREFVSNYYHLRPGTYNITSTRYDSNLELINCLNITTPFVDKGNSFILTEDINLNISNALQTEGLCFNANQFIDFVKVSLESRELSKFEFTKNLSDAIEMIASAGEILGFSRNEMALLEIEEIFHAIKINDLSELGSYWKKIMISSAVEKSIAGNLVLPPILFSEDDLEVIRYYNSRPNFITQKIAEGKIVHVDGNLQDTSSVNGNIVLIENGDPGHDWIFTRNPIGLITKYGGVASHMAIRCAEFGLPAAIGCGELLYEKIANSDFVHLNCREGQIQHSNHKW